jgi:hypothetical protein
MLYITCLKEKKMHLSDKLDEFNDEL